MLIKQAQHVLLQRGYQPGVADGVWGKNTRAALKQFQRDHGLAVSGELDAPTLAALGLLPSATPTASPVSTAAVVTLRARPAELRPDEMVSMIQRRGFHHPDDLTTLGLSPTRVGSFSHHYAADTLQGDPIVSDAATGLMWQQRPTRFVRSRDLQRHLAATNAKPYAGFTDWRLPTLEELASLLEPPDKQRDFLAPVFAMPYWLCLSADRVSGNPAQVWVVFFEDGAILTASADDEYDVLFVRNLRQ